MADRPLLITIIAVLVMIKGLITLIGGAVFAIADTVPDGWLDVGLSWINNVGYVSIISGIIILIIGFSLWEGWTTAWYIGLIYLCVSAVGDIVNILLGNYSEVLSLIIAAVVIYYLFRPQVQEFFDV